jgi:ABC-type multidrug transport system fused ATPase/permease subunit
VDGIDLRELRLSDWRNLIGVVSQDTFIFNASIRENIAFGKLDATESEIVHAARNAHAHDFISELSNGYDTIVGDRGYRLSGGQRQRIAIARAIIRSPEILLLDEATSSLDSHSEMLIHRAINEIRGDRTVLAIAHRLSTIRTADYILVMNKGEAVEQGTHEELLSKNGYYATMWRLQSTNEPVSMVKQNA